ncbi:MAG: hypothetical protein EXS50_00725 [Candidatus Taylorbacteria bacterium]|nr:hypothetical protein [Candidatus Taylorbacteria bacterium]
MLRIYCDNNTTYLPWFKKYDVEVVHFPYENPNRKIRDKVAGSNPTWDQMNMTWDQSTFTWDSFEPSDKFLQIQELLKRSGQNTYVDAQHLDAAYKNGCHIFITTDKTDILNRKEELGDLLNLTFFHPTEDEEELKKMLTVYQKP